MRDTNPMPGKTGMGFLLHRGLEKGSGTKGVRENSAQGARFFHGEERDGNENARERKGEDFEKAIDAATEAGYNRGDK